ncbi:MAG: RNA methyltransferase [Chloroflexota bacterium]|nr:RNA methyltransferase [Chloroflexota bacterium]
MVVLEGRISVEAALRGGARDVSEIIALQPGDRRLARLRGLAAERGVRLRTASTAEIDELASGRTHGGVLALASERRYLAVEQLLADSGTQPFLVMLDGVEDPYNFGTAIRGVYAAGVDGLIVRPRSWEHAAGTVARSSAGASELIPTAVAETSEEAAEVCRAAGLRVVCAAARADAVSMHEADLSGPLFLLVGGERRGITRSFLDRADLIVRIPYARPVLGSLGTATAAAVLAFEAMRQRAG